MFISKSIEIALTEVLKRIVYTVRRPMWESNSTSVYEPFAKYEHIVDMKKKSFVIVTSLFSSIVLMSSF